jgi:hypothetical protein
MRPAPDCSPVRKPSCARSEVKGRNSSARPQHRRSRNDRRVRRARRAGENHGVARVAKNEARLSLTRLGRLFRWLFGGRFFAAARPAGSRLGGAFSSKCRCPVIGVLLRRANTNNRHGSSFQSSNQSVARKSATSNLGRHGIWSRAAAHEHPRAGNGDGAPM